MAAIVRRCSDDQAAPSRRRRSIGEIGGAQVRFLFVRAIEVRDVCCALSVAAAVAIGCHSSGRGADRAGVRGPQAGTALPALPASAIGDVIDVEVGNPIYSHAGCILQTGGSVSCWAGPNILRYYDRGRTEPLPGPWKVAGLDDAVSLFHLVRRHCAIRRSGRGLCWSGEQQAPIELDQLVAITGTGDHACALRKDRTVHCSGQNYNGEIGRPPVRPGIAGGIREGGWAPVPGVSDIVSLSGTCAVRDDGRLLCWGPHALRPVHDWRDTKRFLETLEPQVVEGIPKVIGIAAASKHTCLLTQARTIECGERSEPDQPVTWHKLDLANVAELVSGLGGIVARTEAGELHYWGPGPARNVVDGTEWAKRERGAFGSSTLRRIPGISGAITVSASSSHVCAVIADHHVLCWGHNEYGQLGNGTLDERGASYLVDFQPGLLSGPGEQVFGCKPSLDVRRKCPRLGPSCALEPPPGYWRWGEDSGVRCDDACMERAMAEVKSRAIPACMCTCTDEYIRLQLAEEVERRKPPKP